jgi:hypothetical protein
MVLQEKIGIPLAYDYRVSRLNSLYQKKLSTRQLIPPLLPKPSLLELQTLYTTNIYWQRPLGLE